MSLSKWEKNRRLAEVVNDRWDSAYSVPDWSIVDRWFLPSRCLMLVWIFDEPFWRFL